MEQTISQSVGSGKVKKIAAKYGAVDNGFS